MKVVALLGSPRSNGNSAFIANKFLDKVEALGAAKQTFVLNTLNYRGCQACYACKTGSEKCVLKDDLSEVLAAVSEADVLVLATPVYYGDVTSQLKGYIDRTFSYLVPDYRNNSIPSRLTPGKKLVFIQTQGQADEAFFADIFPRYEKFMKWQGFDEAYLLRACGVSSLEDVLSKQDLLQQVERTASLVTGQ